MCKFRKTLAVTLSLIMILTFIPQSILAAWDGYQESSDNTSLLDFNSFRDIKNFGALPTMTNRYKDNVYSARWAMQQVNKQLEINDLSKRVPTDWSAYDSINLNIYSAKATGSTILVIVHNPVNETNWPYMRSAFTVDWEGWKTIKLDLNSFGANYNATWGNMSEFWLVAHGSWSMIADPKTDLYIGSIDLFQKNKDDFVEYFYDEDTINQTYSDLEGSVGVYAGGANAVTSEGVQKLKYSIEKKNGEIFVPIDFFVEYFGIETSDNGEIIINSSAALEWESFIKDNKTYIPAGRISDALGLYSFTDGNLFVCGTEKTYKALKRPENLGVNEENEIVAYLAKRDAVNFADFTAGDCKAVKDNWKRYILGNEELNNINNMDIKNKIDLYNQTAKKERENLIRSSASSELFSNIISNASGDMTTAYSYIYDMARAYACPGGELYKDKGLKDDILYAIEWMYNNRYGKNTSNREIWKFTGHNNWYDWDIGTPRYMIPTLIFMEDDLSPDKISKYLKYFDERNQYPKLTGANFADIAQCVIGSALLQNQGKRVYQTQVMFEKMYMYVDDEVRFTENQLDKERAAYTPVKGSGFYTDGSYVLHTLHAMNGAYGAGHFSSLCFFSKLFDGTNFKMQSAFQDNLPDIYYNSMDAVQFGTGIFRNVMGRYAEGTNYTGAVNNIVAVFQAASSFDTDNQNKIYSIVKGIVLDNPSVNWKEKLNIESINKLDEILNDDSISPRQDYRLNKVFYNMDKVEHHSKDWAVGISMSSSRVFNYECINNQNMTGWYLGDGRTEWYLKDDSINGTQQYWASIDPYRLPGTTVDTQKREAVSIAQGQEYLSSKDFVGGVTLDNKYGTAAMWLESYHEDKASNINNSGYGGGRPPHKNDLTAKKSYFMFDDEIICLGAEINAKDNNDAEVLTIVDNLLAEKTWTKSEDAGTEEPYQIMSAIASDTPQAENIAENTIDGDISTKWAAEKNAEIVWDLGEVKPLGFVGFVFLNGSKRKQSFVLQVSADNKNWETVFDGESSGVTDSFDYYDLKKSDARYVKFINRGNNAGTAWVSLMEAVIYPPNNDGSIGIKEADVFGDDEIIADGNKVSISGDDYGFGNVNWINVAGKCGYIFPVENSANLGELKGRWTKGINSHYEMWFSHGVNPSQGEYAYIILPGKNADETHQYSENRYISVLSNNGAIQAVKNEKLNITSIVMFRENDDIYEISVSDPTQKAQSIILDIDKELECIDIDDQASSERLNGSTSIKIIPDDGTAGRSYRTVLKYNKIK